MVRELLETPIVGQDGAFRIKRKNFNAAKDAGELVRLSVEGRVVFS